MFKINDKVKIYNSNLFGKIVNITNKYAILCINNKYIKTSINSIVLYNYTENNSCTNLNYSKYTINNEINLRHLDKDEAIFELDNYITQVINSNISDIVIIHGKNSPILKPAVHYYLKNNKHILNYYLDNFNIGITHAKIK